MVDLISRQAALDALKKKATEEFYKRDEYLCLIRDFQLAQSVIEQLPTITETGVAHENN